MNYVATKVKGQHRLLMTKQFSFTGSRGQLQNKKEIDGHSSGMLRNKAKESCFSGKNLP